MGNRSIWHPAGPILCVVVSGPEVSQVTLDDFRSSHAGSMQVLFVVVEGGTEAGQGRPPPPPLVRTTAPTTTNNSTPQCTTTV
ncbi:unnamed protein product [Calypogeia fissa]